MPSLPSHSKTDRVAGGGGGAEGGGAEGEGGDKGDEGRGACG